MCNSCKFIYPGIISRKADQLLLSRGINYKLSQISTLQTFRYGLAKVIKDNMHSLIVYLFYVLE